MRYLLLAVFFAEIARCGLINADAVNASMFSVTTVESGIGLPTDVLPLSSGGLWVNSSPGYGYTQSQMLYFPTPNTVGAPVYAPTYAGNPTNGMLTGTAAMGNNLAVGTFQTADGVNTINIVQPGATPASPMTTVATLQMTYPSAWEHNTVGLAARPTPGVSGSYDLIVNVGAEGDNTATPAGDMVTLTGTGFAATPSASLHGDSLYMIRINTAGPQPAVTNVQQVATGIRNVYGMTFAPNGDFYFADNAIDQIPPGGALVGTALTSMPDGEPPQADELNKISASQLGVGAPLNFGYPTCYTQYAYGGVPGAQVGSGCVQPVAVFQPVTNGTGTHELEGPTDIAMAPTSFPAGFNNGIFIGFAGGETPNDEAGLAYYSFDTGSVTQFIQSENPMVTNIIGVSSTSNALFLSDFVSGNVFEIQSAVPEPGSRWLVCLGVALFGGLGLRKAHR